MEDEPGQVPAPHRRLGGNGLSCQFPTTAIYVGLFPGRLQEDNLKNLEDSGQDWE